MEQRLSSPERQHGTKTKLADVRILQELLRQHRLIEPAGIADGSVRYVAKTLDVNGPVEKSAGLLMDMMQVPRASTWP